MSFEEGFFSFKKIITLTIKSRSEELCDLAVLSLDVFSLSTSLILQTLEEQKLCHYLASYSSGTLSAGSFLNTMLMLLFIFSCIAHPSHHKLHPHG